MPQKRFQIFLGAVFVALFVSALLAGCKVEPVKKTVKRPKANSAPLAKVNAPQIPGDMPKEVPIYPNAELLSVNQTPDGRVLSFKTSDTADKIFGWYFDELDARHWEMKGPTLDVAQNLAIIKAQLGAGLTILLDARALKNDKGELEGSTITLTSTGTEP